MTVDPSEWKSPAADGDGRAVTSRRRFLRATGATAAVTALAGCGGLQERRFVAAAAGLAEAADRGYTLAADRTASETIERAVGETEFRVTVESALRTYEADGDPVEWVGVLSTPSATVLGQSLNPLAGVAFTTLLEEYADQLLRETSFGADGPVQWGNDPAVVGRFEGSLLDADVKGESLAAVTDEGDVALVHAARTTHEGDIVVTASVRRYAGVEDPPERSSEALGRGEVPGEGGVAEQQDAFVETLETVVHPAPDAGTGTPDPTPTGTEAAAEAAGEDPQAILRDVRREPMGGGRERITGRFDRFEPGVGFVGERVRLDDEGFRAALAERAPVESLPAEALAVSTADEAEAASLAARIGRTAATMTAALGLATGRAASDHPPERSLRSRQSPIERQGARGTCVAFAVCAALEAAYDRVGYQMPELSEQYLNHLQKMVVLNHGGADQRDAGGVLTHAGFENLLGTSGGSAVGYQLSLLARYGVPEESEAPVRTTGDRGYIASGDYEDTSQPGDDPSYQWDDPSSALQADVDEFNLADSYTRFQYEPDGPTTLVPFPYQGHRAARYGIDSYLFSGTGGLSRSLVQDPAWVRDVILGGREVVIGYSSGRAKWAEPRPSRDAFGWPVDVSERPDSYDEAAHRQAVDDWEARDGNTYVHDPDGSGGGHAVLVVGYDETGARNHFVAKNSWGVYSKLGYDLFTEGVVYSGGVIMTVEPPDLDPIHEQDVLGEYELVYDGGRGTLNVWRLPGFYDPADLPGGADPATEDRRIGSFVAADGVTYRVNGEVRPAQTDGSGLATSVELRFNVDFSTPNQPYDGYGDTTFETVMHVGRRSLLAGVLLDVQTGPRGCYARKMQTDSADPTGTPRVGASGVDALLGNWRVYSGLLSIFSDLLVTAVDTDRGEFTARLLDGRAADGRAAYLPPVTGTVDAATNRVRLPLDAANVGSLGTPGTLQGRLHGDSGAAVSGVYRTADDRAGMALVRDGDVEPYVEIVTPDDGATVQRDGKKGTRLEAFVVGPEGASVRWYVREQGRTSWRIVGHGDGISAALAAGTYEVEARYDSAAPANAQTTDRITLTVA